MSHEKSNKVKNQRKVKGKYMLHLRIRKIEKNANRMQKETNEFWYTDTGKNYKKIIKKKIKIEFSGNVQLLGMTKHTQVKHDSMCKKQSSGNPFN